MSAREALIQAGVELLERDGLGAVSARSLATAAGTSTMAVYSHFGGMTGVLEAIAGEVFGRFAHALTDAPETDDPVADFLRMGVAYHRFAVSDPQRYQFMFGTSTPTPIAAHRVDMTAAGNVSDRAEWAFSFTALRTAVQRMMAAGRIRQDDELAVAGRLWSLTHGAVMLELAGFFGGDGRGFTHILGPLIVDTLVGMGDDRDAVNRSLQSVLTSLAG
ncbi:TetR/AcrR family transcriptional regulator [Mycobacterium sp. pV006]|uniref:TetR/AcrR family transcriptional regulator n=1 Tax=Mycobacterium sp. pV006 TaxID=3238983 RepID=UPI00351B474A